jgi:thiol-disulfide isomerase/thioredoxin
MADCKLEAVEISPEHVRENLQRDAIVLVKAHWCPHCTAYEPIYREIGKQVPHCTFIIEAGDAQNNPHQKVLLKKYKIEGFPTLLLVKANGEYKTMPAEKDAQALTAAASAFFNS